MCLEVRRDLLVREWRPLRELEVDAQKVARIADVVAGVLVGER
jgi:hypothetical protein